MLVKRADWLLTRPKFLFDILNNSYGYMNKIKSVAQIPDDVISKVDTLRRLIIKTVKGEYTGMKKSKLVLSLAAILYVFMPMDLIPDMIPAMGLIDDIALLAWLFETTGDEYKKFELWEHSAAIVESENNNL